MKQLLTLIVLICSHILCGAQATSLTVDNKVAGTLSQRILYDDKLTVENLVISGVINADDLTYIDELNSKYSLTGTIDMSNVVVVSGGKYGDGDNRLSTRNNTLNTRIFSTDKKIKKFVVPRSITEWEVGSYTGSVAHYYYLNTDSLIVDCPNLKYIGNGIGCPSYLYVGEGLISLDIATKYMDRLPGASDDSYLRAADNMYICLPETLMSLYGHKSMGTPNMTIISKILRPDNLATGSNKWEETVLTNGVVYAPNDTKEYYESSIFKKLTIIAPVSVKSIMLTDTELNMRVGETRHIGATISPNDATNKVIIWASSDNTIASVDSNGNITSHSRGNVVITATSEENADISASCTVTIEQQVTDVTLSQSALTLERNASYQLDVRVYPDNANNKDVIWYSTNEVIASVSNKGVITALMPGQSIIRVETIDGNYSAECALTVTQPVESVTVAPKTLMLKVGEERLIESSVLPTNANDKSVSWSSSDESIAVVNEEGELVGLQPGTVRIKATSNYNNGIFDFCEVTVIQPATGIVLDKTQVELIEEESMQLRANVLPENASNKGVSWTSSDMSIAMISQDGMLYAIKPGKATIMATAVDGGFSALCRVVVMENSGIESVIADKTSNVKVYNINGYLIYEGRYSDAKLTPGFYILKSDGKSYKLRIE